MKTEKQLHSIFTNCVNDTAHDLRSQLGIIGMHLHELEQLLPRFYRVCRQAKKVKLSEAKLLTVRDMNNLSGKLFIQLKNSYMQINKIINNS